MKTITSCILLWLAWLAPVAAELPVIEWVTTTWGTGRIRVKFAGDPCEMRYPAEPTPQMRQMGFTDTPKLKGGTYPIPNYVLNAQAAARSTRRGWTNGGHPVRAGYPGIFYVDKHWLKNERTYAGAFAYSPIGIVNDIPFLSPNLYVKADLDPTELVVTTLHEWAHAAQVSGLGFHVNWLGYWKSFVEGTAVWSEDLPVSVEVQGANVLVLAQENDVRAASIEISPGQTSGVLADDINAPNLRYAGAFLNGYNQNIALAADGYGSYAFWKYFAQRATHSERIPPGTMMREDNIGAIMQFGATASKLYRLDHRAFIETLAKQLPEAGGTDPLNNFRLFFEDFVVAATRLSSKGGVVDRFQDDAFSTMSLQEDLPPEMVFGEALSKQPQEIPASEALGRSQIYDRLALIAKEVGSIAPLGWVRTRIELGRVFPDFINGGMRRFAPPFENRRLFLLVLGSPHSMGRSELALAALTAAGPVGVISPEVKMDRLQMSLQSLDDMVSVQGRYCAYTSLSTFHSKGDMERLYLSIGNVDPGNRSQQASIGYVVAPQFAAFTSSSAGRQAKTGGGPREVWLTGTLPERQTGHEAVQGGDELTFEVGVTDKVHLGTDEMIDAKETTLKVKVLSPGGAEVPVENVRMRCFLVTSSDPSWQQPCYEVKFKLPKEMAEAGEHKVRFDLSSLLRLGPDDRDSAETTLLVGGKGPQVLAVKVEGEEGESFYDSLTDDFQPVPPGKSRLTITFDQKLAPEDGKHSIQLGGRKITGQLNSDRQEWAANLDIPADPKAFTEWKGLNKLSISATSESGVPLDADPKAEGPQPDTGHQMVIDVPPPWVKRLSATADDRMVYEAEWPSAEKPRTDWRASSTRRKLEYKSRTRVPATASRGIMRFEMAAAVENTPVVRVDGQTMNVKEDGEGGTRWSCEIDWKTLLENAAPGKPVQIELIASNRHGAGLDADPSSQLEISTPDTLHQRIKTTWLGYESQFAGGTGDGTGGPDLWHQLNIEEDPQWIEEEGDQPAKTFTLLQRGDQMIAQFDVLEYRGRRSADGRWTLRADSTLDESLSNRWYHTKTRHRISTPARAIQEAFARGSRDLHYLKLINEVSNPQDEWKFAGEYHNYTLRWDNDGKLYDITPPGFWNKIRWKPRVAPLAETPAPAPKKEAEDIPKDQPVTTRTAYQVVEQTAGGFKIVTVERISFRQHGQSGARLVVTAHPVSYVEDRSGTRGLLYNIQWSSGRDVVTRLATKGDGIPAIIADFETRAAGGMPRTGLDARLKSIFGMNSQSLRATSTAERAAD